MSIECGLIHNNDEAYFIFRWRFHFSTLPKEAHETPSAESGSKLIAIEFKPANSSRAKEEEEEEEEDGLLTPPKQKTIDGYRNHRN